MPQELLSLIASLVKSLMEFSKDKRIVAFIGSLLVAGTIFIWFQPSFAANLVATESDRNFPNCEREYVNGLHSTAIQCFETIVESKNLFNNPEVRASSYYYLGDSYIHGHGVAIDKERSFSFYKKAVDLGDTRAMVEIGHHAELGEDFSKAQSYYKRAADEGDREAMYRLGSMYQRRPEFNNNFKEALHWYSEAVKKGLSKAALDLAYLHFKGFGMESPDYKRAIDWYKRSDHLLRDEDCYRLGLMYSRGKYGIDQDLAKAAKSYRRAANLGHTEATLELAKMRRPTSMEEAIELYESIVEKSDAAKRELAKTYRDNKAYMDKDRSLALFLAIETKSPEDFFNLGLTYRHLNDYDKSMIYYRRSFEGGYREAAAHLAYIYAKELKPRDQAQSKEWHEKATR